MFYIRHYAIYPYDQQLHRILEEQYSIQVDVCHNPLTKVIDSFVFDIAENHPRFDEIECILPTEYIPLILSSDQIVQRYVIILYSPQYSLEELRSAKWLEARNTTAKVTAINGETLNTYRCSLGKTKIGSPIGRHRDQIELYSLNSPIKWGRSFFVSCYANQERLFCNTLARTILEKNNITGIDFSPVLKKSTSQPLDNIFQVRPQNTMPVSAIIPIHDMQRLVCDQCGMPMLRWTSGKCTYGIREGFLDENIDCWQTDAMFVSPSNSTLADATRRLIISQHMYRTLVDNKLDRGFVFLPLELRE